MLDQLWTVIKPLAAVVQVVGKTFCSHFLKFPTQVHTLTATFNPVTLKASCLVALTDKLRRGGRVKDKGRALR